MGDPAGKLRPFLDGNPVSLKNAEYGGFLSALPPEAGGSVSIKTAVGDREKFELLDLDDYYAIKLLPSGFVLAVTAPGETDVAIVADVDAKARWLFEEKDEGWQIKSWQHKTYLRISEGGKVDVGADPGVSGVWLVNKA